MTDNSNTPSADSRTSAAQTTNGEGSFSTQAMTDAFDQVSKLPGQWIQRLGATWELTWGGSTRDWVNRLQTGLATSGASQSLTILKADVAELIRHVSAEQFTVIIEALPMAAHRALVASLVYHTVQDPESELGAASAKAYGLSQFPMVVGAEGDVQVDASSALISALIGVSVTQTTLSVAGSLMGSVLLSRLLKSSDQLRQAALKQGGDPFSADEWAMVREVLMQGSSPEPDWYLMVTNTGVQGAQIGEFLSKALRNLSQNELLLLIAPLPLRPFFFGVALLTNDVVLSVGRTAESAWDGANASRRLELAFAQLAQAKRLPTPEQFIAAEESVMAATDQAVRSLLVKYLYLVVEGFDPQLRNQMLNEWGQRLNQWNPLQFFQGSISGDWIESMVEALESAWEAYPKLESLKVATTGLREAREYGLAVEQARVLRRIMVELDPDADPESL